MSTTQRTPPRETYPPTRIGSTAGAHCVDSMNLHEYFDYRDGHLYWKAERPLSCFKDVRARNIWHTRYASKMAGCIRNDGYRVINIGGTMHLAHRLIWAMHHGGLTSGIEIDHINMDRSDNSISNLRLASRSENARNIKTPRHNTSGFKGVVFNSCRGKWYAQIKVMGINHFLGSYSTPELAHDAYCKASLRLHGSFGRKS